MALGVSGKAFYLAYNTELDAASPNFASVAFVHIQKEVKTPPPSTEVPDRSLAEGENSADVLLLQNFLVWKGLLTEDNATGYFGPTTLEAVKEYQSSKNLDPEGIVGPQTRTAWAEDVGSGL